MNEFSSVYPIGLFLDDAPCGERPAQSAAGTGLVWFGDDPLEAALIKY